MNKLHLLLSTLCCGAMLALPSCSDDDDYNYDLLRPTAIVTVLPESDGSFLMQLDKDTQLIPANMTSSPFGNKEVRALVNYSETSSPDQSDKLRKVEVNWIDSIRTKLPVESLGDLDDKTFGKDPIEIVNDWVTIAEDGYLTLRVRTLWGSPGMKHIINLVTGTNPSDPYELVLRHDAQGDTYGEWGDALVAFNLNGLSEGDSGPMEFNLRWMSFTGEKSVKFKLDMRPAAATSATGAITYSGRVD